MIVKEYKLFFFLLLLSSSFILLKSCTKKNKSLLIDRPIQLNDYLSKKNKIKPKITSLKDSLIKQSYRYISDKYGTYSETINRLDSIQIVLYLYDNYMAPFGKPHNSDVKRDLVIAGEDTLKLDYLFNYFDKERNDSYTLENIYEISFLDNKLCLIDFYKYLGTNSGMPILYSLLIFNNHHEQKHYHLYNRLNGIEGIGDFAGNKKLDFFVKSPSDKFSLYDTLWIYSYSSERHELYKNNYIFIINKEGYVSDVLNYDY